MRATWEDPKRDLVEERWNINFQGDLFTVFKNGFLVPQRSVEKKRWSLFIVSSPRRLKSTNIKLHFLSLLSDTAVLLRLGGAYSPPWDLRHSSY
jgi:hypothetical protein